jgi:FkbM family methyltransferase
VIKIWLRDLLPIKFQVPAKFFINLIRGQLEDELKLLPWLVGPSSKTIDIGGNRGVYSYQLWRLGASVEVFEPNPTCAEVLTKWASGKEHVRVHGVAVSDQAGSATLHIPQDNSGVEHDASASLVHGDFQKARQIEVKLQTLDSFGFTDISFIKIDVEGHETDVLRGAEQTIKSSSPALLIEIEQRHNQRNIWEIFNDLANWGYRGYFFSSGKLYSLSNFSIERDQPLVNFNFSNARYINNFLFLGEFRSQRGDYKQLLQEYGS